MVRKLINANRVPRDRTTYTRPSGAGNFDNMDDKNIVDQINIKIGTQDLAPTLDNHIVNKKYVDDAVAGASGLWEVDGSETQLKTADEIDMQTKKIINLVDPTDNQDAATKKYVDDEIDAKIEDGDTTGQTAYWDNTAAQWKKNSSVFWDAVNSRLGIGTTTPAEKMDIYVNTVGSLQLKGNNYATRLRTTDAGGVYWEAGTHANPYAFWQFNAAGGTNNLKTMSRDFRIYSNTIAHTTSILTAEHDTGRIGIGTTTPNEKLHVVGRVIEQGTFAEIYLADGSTAQTIGTGATYTKSTAFATNGQSANCTADAANDKITITKTGRYMVNINMNGMIDTANTRVDFALFNGGTICDNIKGYSEFVAFNKECLGHASGIIDVTTANTDIDLRLRHDDGGDVDITCVNLNMSVHYLGET